MISSSTDNKNETKLRGAITTSKDDHAKGLTLGEQWIISPNAAEELRLEVLRNPIKEIERIKDWTDICRKLVKDEFLRNRWDRLSALLWSAQQFTTIAEKWDITSDITWAQVLENLKKLEEVPASVGIIPSFTVDCLLYWQGYLNHHIKGILKFHGFYFIYPIRSGLAESKIGIKIEFHFMCQFFRDIRILSFINNNLKGE